MGIGTLRCPVLDVDDLLVAERFWSEVTGLAVISSVFPGRYSYLGRPDPWRHELILHLVKEKKQPGSTNRAHVDIWVRDVDTAIAQVEAIGGRVKRAPTIYPRPGTFPEPPTLDWAVMHDPFGNEFCVINVLTPEQSAAVAHAAPGDDEDYREAAGRAAPT